MVVRLVMGIINGNSSPMHTPSTQKDELERLFSFWGESFSHFARLTWKIVCDTTEYLHSALIGYLHPITVSIHAHFYQKKKRERKKGAHGVGKTRVITTGASRHSTYSQSPPPTFSGEASSLLHFPFGFSGRAGSSAGAGVGSGGVGGGGGVVITTVCMPVG